MNKLLFKSIRDVNLKISAGTLLPSELCKAAADLTSIIEPLNAYITVTDELAISQSINADERQKNSSSLGILDGIPIAMKDNYCISGQLTSCGSKMLSNFVPIYNATVFERLARDGAILIGKTNLDEFAMGSGTIDSHYGPTKNLWGSEILSKYYYYEGSKILNEKEERNNIWHIAGGSSGGSAVAVATGTCYAAIGSDTGGSTRNPASYCGLVGLKPTYGLVSRYGLIPLVNSMDVPGILTRTVDDAVLILNAIAGPDHADSTTLKKEYTPFSTKDSINLENLVIGIPKEYNVPNINEEILECWMHVTGHLKEGGAKIVSVSLPYTEFSITCYSILNRCEVASNMARYDGVEYGYRSSQGKSFQELYRNSRSEGLDDIVKERIFAGNYFLLAENYEEYYVKAMKMRRLISQDFDNVWNSNVDLLLTPTTLTEAPKYENFVKLDNQMQCLIQDYCTQPVNMAGLPAINVPIRLSRNSLPLSLQLIAPALHEERLCNVAKYIEKFVNFPKLELLPNIFK